MDNEFLLVMTTSPDEALAKSLAHTLVQGKLAACVQISSLMTSVYEWQGEICEEKEFCLQIKCLAKHYAAIETAVLELHPYDVPELIAVPVTQGLPAYFDWIKETTQP
ncbi:divalent-cation tolerance protein CutA [Shewanella sp. Choline-02u-19]|uniref:divalent-cation tolerance protein CutA n=1 Tax=Shewanella TaxID=22 RepID=UPI000C339E5B|nr:MULTISPECIES: divalent-cation tolerance protein CutA [Shewanella]MCL1057395.1 divalent-cation tolerance protein CutA [Shewanella gelidimarina]PKG55266.1 divalent-cation tolerance protein CutA [Shewanella sp. GutDb-MelDb]PKG73608.1 divalent-cation tolerance protein CutA [Shewanella sp. GutCb]PKH55625.1 divalent-cation tolerance protein CutA [Shewanella sp. Bg11-22]PKI29901.1 divalent-cation tolerance protein CutA [Shewanella sp. Choline-02u-19]